MPRWRARAARPSTRKWYANVRKNPVLDLQDDDRTWTVRARELEGAEREEWWPRCVEAFPPYADYQVKTDRLIPVFVLEPSRPVGRSPDRGRAGPERLSWDAVRRSQSSPSTGSTSGTKP